MAIFRIDGVEEIRRAFRELPRRIASRTIRQSIRTALGPVKARVEQLAPKRTGRLAKKVKIRARANRRRGTIALEVRIGAGDFRGTTYYAAFVEYGTERQEPQQYMARAFDQTQEEARATCIRLIREGVDREVKALS
jgi:HK97 gp10 family phage protein